ncbi:MAG: enoyl-CoA hydratase/isomerase family protein [Thermoplasmata archaeon]|nr:MAG: enoyl-CoA hydratase/isomerase family protein [Thermoplasmata archaeon]
MMEIPTDLVRAEDRGAVRWIILNRERRHNAIDLMTAKAWAQALTDASTDKEVRAVVMAGNGPSFCSGGDLKAFKEADDRVAYVTAVASAIGLGVNHITSMPKPVVAAVHGNAMGVGFTLFLGADYKVLAEGTRMAMSYINVGLTPGGGGTWMLSRIVGQSKAMEMILLGDPIDAAQALDMRIANEVVPRDDLEDRAQAMAERLAAQAPGTLARTKELMWSAHTVPLQSHLMVEAETIGRAAGMPEFEEGANAFFERRKPEF